jgi:hypothetical protein
LRERSSAESESDGWVEAADFLPNKMIAEFPFEHTRFDDQSSIEQICSLEIRTDGTEKPYQRRSNSVQSGDQSNGDQGYQQRILNEVLTFFAGNQVADFKA